MPPPWRRIPAFQIIQYLFCPLLLPVSPLVFSFLIPERKGREKYKICMSKRLSDSQRAVLFLPGSSRIILSRRRR